MDFESEIRMRLAEIDREYMRRREPLIKMLISLESMKPPKPIILNPAEIGVFKELGGEIMAGDSP